MGQVVFGQLGGKLGWALLFTSCRRDALKEESDEGEVDGSELRIWMLFLVQPHFTSSPLHHQYFLHPDFYLSPSGCHTGVPWVHWQGEWYGLKKKNKKDSWLVREENWTHPINGEMKQWGFKEQQPCKFLLEAAGFEARRSWWVRCTMKKQLSTDY